MARLLSGTQAVRLGPLSRLVDARAVLVIAALAVGLLALAVLSLCLGGRWLPPVTALRGLAGQGTDEDILVVGLLRAPRLVLAALAGGALALSGHLLQTLVRNPLASPDILGMTSGASAAAVAFFAVAGTGTVDMAGLPLATTAGAWVASALVLALAWQKGVTPLRLVLVGVAVSALFGAVTTWLLVASPLASATASYVWLTGSVFGATWSDVGSLTVWLALLLPVLVWASRRAAVLRADDAVATGVGLPVTATRLLLMALSVGLAGAAIAHAGAMAFVGLVAPHIGRRLVGGGFAVSAWSSALVGALLVMLADLAGRMLFAPRDLPAGIFVAALGAVFFVFLLSRQRR